MGLESWAESFVASHFLLHINRMRQVAFILHKAVRCVEKMGSIAACIPTSFICHNKAGQFPSELHFLGFDTRNIIWSKVDGQYRFSRSHFFLYRVMRTDAELCRDSGLFHGSCPTSSALILAILYGLKEMGSTASRVPTSFDLHWLAQGGFPPFVCIDLRSTRRWWAILRFVSHLFGCDPHNIKTV